MPHQQLSERRKTVSREYDWGEIERKISTDLSSYKHEQSARLGLAGGGTDVLPYCYQLEGAVLNATINRHCYVTLQANDRTKFVAVDLGITEDW